MTIRQCVNCNKEVKVTPQRDVLERIYCSRECLSEYKREKRKNTICPICDKLFYVKKDHKDITKNCCCSLECSSLLRKETYKGELNSQFGLTGALNGSFKTGLHNTFWGYEKILVHEHPFKDVDGCVFKHRLVAEQYLLNEENSVTIDGIKYLNPKCIVHHIDFNRKNNSPENLFVFKDLSTHTFYHSMFRKNKISIEEFVDFYEKNLMPTYENYSWMYNEYINKKIGYTKIAKNLGIGHTMVKNKLIFFNIIKKEERD